MQKSLYELTQLSPREASDKYRRVFYAGEERKPQSAEGQLHQDPVN